MATSKPTSKKIVVIAANHKLIDFFDEVDRLANYAFLVVLQGDTLLTS